VADARKVLAGPFCLRRGSHLSQGKTNAGDHRCDRKVGIESVAELSTQAYLSGVFRLADGARFVGLCDKIGRGIDPIFEGLLSEGLAFPEFNGGDNLFTARIPFAGRAEFKEFLRKRSQAL
jgi:hypothetical protein